MIKRLLTKEVKVLSQEFPIVAILGPRQSGKTTLAQNLFRSYKYVSLEDPDIRSIALEDPRSFLDMHPKKVIFDEIQKTPELFSYLQTTSDHLNEAGSFVITGSHNYLLIEKISQSLAGRVGLSTLLPFSVQEIKDFRLSLDEMILRGSYPRVYDKNIRPISFYRSYLSTYIEKDVRLLKNIANYDLFLKFVKILAGRVGQVINFSAISDECGISQKTVREWVSVLETSFLIFKLPPFYKNYKKRLIKNPKIYFYDTGLVCFLLGIKSVENLQTHYLRGGIFENFVISDLIKNNFNQGELKDFYYFRDSRGLEIDLISEENSVINFIEIKSSKTFQPEFLKNLKKLNEISKSNKKNFYLIYDGQEAFNIDSIQVMPWHQFK